MVSTIPTIRPPRQRSARNDSDMRDGDSAHGNPYESAADQVAIDSDADVGDTTQVEEGVERSLTVRTHASEVVPPTTEPLSGYLQLSVPEILEQVRLLNLDQIEQVIAFEKAHRNRKTLLIKLGRMIRPSKHPRDNSINPTDMGESVETTPAAG